MRFALFVGVATVSLLTACGAAQRQSDLYTAVPESAWPQMDGVSVVKSKGFEGFEGGESHVGRREIVVQLSSNESRPILALQQSLGEAGWTQARCAGANRPAKQLCVETSGLFAVLEVPHSQEQQSEGLVHVALQRSP